MLKKLIVVWYIGMAVVLVIAMLLGLLFAAFGASMRDVEGDDEPNVRRSGEAIAGARTAHESEANR